MKKRYWLLLLLLGVLLAPPGWAQTAPRPVTGLVTAVTDQSPLPGVTVLVKGTTIGSTTGSDGRFALSAAPGAVLVFSFIGFTSQERTVGADGAVDVSLKESTAALDEVIVTSLGIRQERREVNYGAQQVSGEEIIDTRQSNIVNALQGKVAGVSITSSGGAPGEGSSIVIRGGNSLDGDNQPLFVIDGVIMDNSSFAESSVPGGGSGFNGLLGRSAATPNRASDINPEDVASITVLKGPAASALYGLRAGNGAVIITTKKGVSGRTAITYRTQYSVDEVNRLPTLQDVYKQGTNGIFDPAVRTSWGPRFGPAETVYDNLGNFFEKGHNFQNYLTLSGGTEKATFFLSASNLTQTGIVPNSAYDKSSVRLSGTVQLSPKLTAGASANYINSGGTRPFQGQGLFGNSAQPSGVYLSLINWPRNDDARNYENADGTRRRLLGALGSNDPDNPYFTAERNPQSDRTNRLISNVTLGYMPTKWLGFNYVLVFSPNAISDAPHNLAATVSLDGPADKRALLAGLVRGFPATSVIEIGPVVSRARDILGQMGTAILAAASVAILAGLAVLIGAIAAARASRLYDNVILRVLGASRGQLLGLQLAEYGLLALILGTVALGLGSAAAWLVIVQLFEFEWLPDWSRILGVLGLGVATVLGFALAGSLPLLRARPAQALRDL